MKYIISKTSEPIKFNLTSSRHLIIDTTIPVQVTDEEFIVLENRLGSQISLVTVPGFSEPTSTPEVVVENQIEKTPEGATATAEEVVVSRDEVVADLGKEAVVKIEEEAEEVKVEDKEE